MSFSGTEPRRALFVAPTEADYLAITLLHGLRSQFGAGVVDFPKYEIAYQNYPEAKRPQVYGRGFTAFFNLEDIQVDRDGIEAAVRGGKYDLIVFGCIWRQFPLFARWRKWLSPRNTILCDGADSPQVYPHAGLWWRQPAHWFLPAATRGFLYFKREWTDESQFRGWHRLLPRSLWKHLPQYGGLRRISFSIPEEKIVEAWPKKTKDFGRHIVDPEVAAGVPGSSTRYAFASEAEYYADLQAARFGITTRRAGWDCLRHYEIAANGCVPCFRNLQEKPSSCAPHDLTPGANCLSYRQADDLFVQIRALTESDYMRLQQGALDWVRAKSTSMLAKEVMAERQRARENRLVECPAVESARLPG